MDGVAGSHDYRNGVGLLMHIPISDVDRADVERFAMRLHRRARLMAHFRNVGVWAAILMYACAVFGIAFLMTRAVWRML